MCVLPHCPTISVQKATMLMLAGIVVLHITTIILLLVATIDNVSRRPVISCHVLTSRRMYFSKEVRPTLKPLETPRSYKSKDTFLGCCHPHCISP